MSSITPPVADLNRVRLRQLASWIRDELDPMIAQEGPEILRANDVLILHEFFQALRISPSITALDLRATGIHRAVLEVAGTATRWPGRLADDCDRIIFAWRHKFGRLEDLRPFMYGRGGRLENIAKLHELSSAVILKRWQTTCPDKIAPKRSRRQGDLGFKAGIIDFESSKGGVCFDKHGAYAVVLKDTGEIEASDSSRFTYRCAQGDLGKFRLTSATVKSRGPIRVLRCHSLNSVWGPKAGTRYEGLYRVLGWTIHTAKSDDIVGKEYKASDILYEVRFERVDSMPIKEVLKRPTASELDDYTEYKRLRRAQRAEHRKGVLKVLDSQEVRVSAKFAPPIPPANTTIPQSRTITQKALIPSRAVTTTFKDPVATIVEPKHLQLNLNNPSFATSKSSADSGVGPMAELERSPSLRPPTSSSDLAAPPTERPDPRNTASDSPLASSSPHLQQMVPALMSRNSDSVEGSHLSRGGSHHSYHSDIKKITPWIDYDLELIAAPPSIAPQHVRGQQADPIKLLARSKTRNQCTARVDVGSSHPDPINISTSIGEAQPKKNIEGKKHRYYLAGSKAKYDKKSAPDISRLKNPLAKLFDGADGSVDEASTYLSTKRSQYPPISVHSNPKVFERRSRPSSSDSDGTNCPLSPIPSRPLSPLSALVTLRRDTISFPYTPAMISTRNLTNIPEYGKHQTR